jgi:hypothetical protein
MDNPDTRLKVRIVDDVVEHCGPNAPRIASAKHVGRSNEPSPGYATPVSLLSTGSECMGYVCKIALDWWILSLAPATVCRYSFLFPTSFTNERKRSRTDRSLCNITSYRH